MQRVSFYNGQSCPNIHNRGGCHSANTAGDRKVLWQGANPMRWPGCRVYRVRNRAKVVYQQMSNRMADIEEGGR